MRIGAFDDIFGEKISDFLAPSGFFDCLRDDLTQVGLADGRCHKLDANGIFEIIIASLGKVTFEVGTKARMEVSREHNKVV